MAAKQQRYYWWRIAFTALAVSGFLIVVFWGGSDLRWLFGAILMLVVNVVDQIYNIWLAKQSFKRSDYWQTVVIDGLQLAVWIAILFFEPLANPYLAWSIGLAAITALIVLIGDIRLKRYIV